MRLFDDTKAVNFLTVPPLKAHTVLTDPVCVLVLRLGLWQVCQIEKETPSVMNKITQLRRLTDVVRQIDANQDIFKE